MEQIPNQEKEPNVRVNFLLTAHGAKEDFRKLKSRFKESDIYAPEFAFGPEMEDELARLSNGELTVDDFIKLLKEKYPKELDLNEGGIEILDTIYSSHKPILAIDIDSGFVTPDLEEKRKKASDDIKNSIAQFEKANIQEAIRLFLEAIKYLVDEFIKNREGVVVDNFKKQVPNLKEKFPQLAHKDTIEILVTFGAVHTSLPRKIEEELGLPTSREFNAMPYQYSFMHEVARRYQYNKEISEDLMLKAIFETIYIGKILRKLTKDTELQYRMGRKIVSGIHIDQIKEIANQLSRGSKFGDILDQFGIPRPKNEKELEDIQPSSAQYRGDQKGQK